MSVRLGQLPRAESAIFLLCDVQAKFKDAVQHYHRIVQNASKLLQAGRVLGVPLVVTEQYPKGLGHTDTRLEIGHALATVEKTKFSMIVPQVQEHLDKVKPSAAVIMGLEAHICVEQTAADLLAQGVVVHVVADAVSSRSQEDRLLAFQRLRQMGCFISTTESIIFKLIGDKDHPKFSEIRGLVKEKSAETGLAWYHQFSEGDQLVQGGPAKI